MLHSKLNLHSKVTNQTKSTPYNGTRTSHWENILLNQIWLRNFIFRHHNQNFHCFFLNLCLIFLKPSLNVLLKKDFPTAFVIKLNAGLFNVHAAFFRTLDKFIPLLLCRLLPPTVKFCLTLKRNKLKFS